MLEVFTSGELAVALSAGTLGGCETMSLGVARLVWTHVVPFSGTVMLGASVLSVILVEMCIFSTISDFGHCRPHFTGCGGCRRCW